MALLMCGGALPALAQTSIGASGVAMQTAPTAGLDDIIVTAQKRSERLNDVPLSLTVASGVQLAKEGVVRPADLEKIVPGFTYQPSSYGVPVFSIRGIGFYETSLAVAPTVSVYVDQVPLAYSAMTEGASLDLEQVEVLKGPQGILFGQNATGGAINYIAAKPTRDLHAGVELGYGRFNAFDGQGFISGPLTDTLSARFAIRTEQHGDWQKSETRNDTLGHRDFTTARLLLDWAPTDAVKFEVNANGWRDRSDTQAAQFVGYYPPAPFNYHEQEAALSVYRPAPNDARIADWDPNTSLRRDDRFYQLSLRGDFRLSDTVALASITAYSDLKEHAPNDTDGTYVNNFLLTIDGGIKSFSQELRLSGDLAGDRIKWMVGGNYSHDSTTDHEHGHYFGSNSGVGPFRYTDFVNVTDQKIESEAVFGTLDYALTRTLTVQGGLRYTWADRDAQGCLADYGDGALADAFGFLSSILRGFAPPVVTLAPGSCVTLDDENAANRNLPAGLVHKSLHEHNLSWRVGLDWKPDRDTLLYANVTKGYKAGSFPTIPAIAASELDPVVQESVLAYETGFKLSPLERTLHLDGALFYYKYNNKQFRGRLDTGPPFGLLEALINIPRSSVRGAELSATWRPLPPLTLRAGATYVESRVDSSFTTYAPLGALVNIQGDPFPNTPKWQLTADAEYSLRLSDTLGGYVGANGHYRTKSNAAFGRDAVFDLPAYVTLDLRAGVESETGHWHVEVWGRNVTNTFYTTQVIHLIDPVARITGMPVTYGFTVGFRY